MERNGRERAELAQRIKSHQGRKHVCLPEPLSCDPERWGRLCREHGDQKRENKDKKTSETGEDIWTNRKAEAQERRRSPQQVETRSRANQSDPQLFSFQRSGGGSPFSPSVNEKYFYPPKRKGQGEAEICFLKGRAEGKPDCLFLKRLK